jgi:ethanolamine utilization protein EutQ
MAAGMMSWKKEDSFPWKLTYEEIDYVIEGELAITINGKTYNGQPGDVFYIPKGSDIVFGTPSSVKIMYVTYPANWAEQN